jgi:hypothetical protein
MTLPRSRTDQHLTYNPFAQGATALKAFLLSGGEASRTGRMIAGDAALASEWPEVPQRYGELRRLREEAMRFSRSDLAALFAVSLATVDGVEAGTLNPDSFVGDLTWKQVQLVYELARVVEHTRRTDPELLNLNSGFPTP